MKTQHITLLAAALLSASTAFAQTITCDLFTVTGLAPDEFNVNNTLINIQMGGTDSDFANYPYIASVTDCSGDTVATGGMFFFGQIGGTEQGHPVSAMSSDVCLPLTIEFIYGNDLFENDTCFLTYGSTGVNFQNRSFNEFNVFPNPTQGEIQIESSLLNGNTPYILSDYMGKVVLQGMSNSGSNRIYMEGLSSGVYLLHMGNETVKVVKE